jgi:hypothetical protein
MYGTGFDDFWGMMFSFLIPVAGLCLATIVVVGLYPCSWLARIVKRVFSKSGE